MCFKLHKSQMMNLHENCTAQLYSQHIREMCFLFLYQSDHLFLVHILIACFKAFSEGLQHFRDGVSNTRDEHGFMEYQSDWNHKSIVLIERSDPWSDQTDQRSGGPAERWSLDMYKTNMPGQWGVAKIQLSPYQAKGSLRVPLLQKITLLKLGHME